MSENEAKEKANEIMSITTGVGVESTSPGKYRSVGGRSSWTSHYKGFMVVVNDKDGSVSLHESR